MLPTTTLYFDAARDGICCHKCLQYGKAEAQKRGEGGNIGGQLAGVPLVKIHMCLNSNVTKKNQKEKGTTYKHDTKYKSNKIRLEDNTAYKIEKYEHTNKRKNNITNYKKDKIQLRQHT